MNKKNLTADFHRKPYAKPQTEAILVETSGIICTSPTSTSQNEEYEEEETDNWFN